jgi:hypothetical protein
VQFQDFSVKQVRDYFKAMSKDLLQQYVNSGASVLHLTVDAGTLLYIPAAFLFGERVSRDSANFGVRLGVACPDSTGVAALKIVMAEKDSFGKDSKIMVALQSELEAQQNASK